MSWQDYASELSVNLAQRRGAAGEPPYKVFGQLPSFDHAELRADFDWLDGRLLACGVGQAVVVDLSQAALGIPVVRVVVPGLEGPMSTMKRLCWEPGRGRLLSCTAYE